MRVVDFFIYYVTTLYKNNPRGSLLWDGPVRRTVFIVGLTFTLLLFSIVEAFLFLLKGVNITDFNISKLALIIVGLIITQVLRYIYIVKKRYKLITSIKYRTFTLDNRVGVIICVTVSCLSFLLFVGIAIAINIYIKR
jgi:hypothetical protein